LQSKQALQNFKKPHQVFQGESVLSIDAISNIIIGHARDIVPGLADHTFTATDSLKGLGANSIDRADIIMMTLETLKKSMPLMELAKAENIADLSRLIHEKA
jgi:polyketide biosynthesis acyl carrier protein